MDEGEHSRDMGGHEARVWLLELCWLCAPMGALQGFLRGAQQAVLSEQQLMRWARLPDMVCVLSPRTPMSASKARWLQQPADNAHEGVGRVRCAWVAAARCLMSADPGFALWPCAVGLLPVSFRRRQPRAALDIMVWGNDLASRHPFL